jgi:hypothetical protein
VKKGILFTSKHRRGLELELPIEVVELGSLRPFHPSGLISAGVGILLVEPVKSWFMATSTMHFIALVDSQVGFAGELC